MSKPKIGVICFVFQSINTGVFLIQTGYIRSILDAGGTPIVIPVTEDLAQCKIYMDMVDGLLVPGGEDIAPEFYGEDPVPQVNYINREKDIYEMEMIRLAREAGKPIFGICRGQQMINVALGGTLYQDIPSQVKGSICHSQSGDLRSVPTHKVTMEKGSMLQQVLGDSVMTNSYHHQAIKDIAPELKAVGYTSDGVIEATESADGRIYTVQWHPEHLYKTQPVFTGLFKRLVELSK